MSLKAYYANMTVEEREKDAARRREVLASSKEKRVASLRNHRANMTEEEKSKDICAPKYWEIKSPNGVIIKGTVLRRLVLENSHLFNEEDLKRNSIGAPRAEGGLRRLFSKEKGKLNIRTNWKGWTALNVPETSRVIPERLSPEEKKRRNDERAAKWRSLRKSTRTPEEIKALRSEKIKEAWAKKNPEERKLSPEEAIKRATQLRTSGNGPAFAEWRRSPEGRAAMSFKSAEMRAKIDKEKQLEKNRETGKKREGIPMRLDTKVGKTENHWAGKWWRLRSPKNVTIEGRNLNEVIRKNEHLFDPEAVKWTSKGWCRASGGLHALAANNPKATSWHGWTLMLVMEGSENPVYEEVDRPVITHEDIERIKYEAIELKSV